MKTDLDIKKLAAKYKSLVSLVIKHAAFIALILVLLVYVFVVLKINATASAEPTDEQAQSTIMPKIDKKLIDKIQSLEQSSPDVHSLFNSARNNPFQE